MQKQPEVPLAVWTAPTLLLPRRWKQHEAGDEEQGVGLHMGSFQLEMFYSSMSREIPRKREETHAVFA